MNNFRIFETDEFLKNLNKIPHRDSIFIKKKCTEYIYPQIKQQPYFGTNIKKLKNYQPETWRYKIGKYRIFYLIDDQEKIISIITVDFRKDIYK